MSMHQHWSSVHSTHLGRGIVQQLNWGVELNIIWHIHLMGKMMWHLKDGQVPNLKKAALYEVLICDGKSNCNELVDPSNRKHKCWFTLKWVVSKEDLAHLYKGRVWYPILGDAKHTLHLTGCPLGNCGGQWTQLQLRRSNDSITGCPAAT